MASAASGQQYPRSEVHAYSMDRNTIIEDAPQVSLRRAPPSILHRRSSTASPLSDNFPTPKANNILASITAELNSSPTSSDGTSDNTSIWSRSISGSEQSEFDEMYDLSASESEGDVPIKLSQSVKKRIVPPRKRCLSLAIPSPSQWPTVEKLKSAITPISPATKINLAPSVLAQIQSKIVPSSSSTPSLDGSSTDDGLSSCPSTPDMGNEETEDLTWEIPIQLDPSSITLLKRLSNDNQEQQVETVIEISEERAQEMQERMESPRTPGLIRLETQNIAPADPVDGEDELSILSIPTPGGFFASLDSVAARHTWCGDSIPPNTSTATEFYDLPFRSNEPLPTSTATNFYNLPWDRRPDNPIEQTIMLEASPEEEDEPITALRIVTSPDAIVSSVEEIDETYDDTLKKSAAANIDRTMLWLGFQTDYMRSVCEEDDDDVVESFKDVADAVPTTPEQSSSPSSTDVSPAKKSVRFADEEPVAVQQKMPGQKRTSPIHDGTFWEGWRHTKRSQRARDVFQHRQARAEAEHVKRISCQKQHIEQLHGKYEIKTPERPVQSRPISDLIGSSSEDESKEKIARAERERQALEQMQSSAWHISAQKETFGGRLLTSPIVQSFKVHNSVRILDLGGQVHCSWAWNVAMEHPEATVYTTVSTDAEAHVAESTLDGPANHFVVAAPKLWQIPFDDNYFDIISARNLYTCLKSIRPKGETIDEWDLTLRECVRCLKPGGYLEFNLMDAELVHPEPAGQALGVEFAFNLRTRGYNPCSGKTFLPRLKRAGFHDIKRAWMLLPVADVAPQWCDTGKVSNKSSPSEKSIGPSGEVEPFTPQVTGSTKDVRAVTGMVGARMWEQWILKLNCEMGRDESRCLEGVAKALEECGKGNAGWRCLVGWAKKDL